MNIFTVQKPNNPLTNAKENAGCDVIRAPLVALSILGAHSDITAARRSSLRRRVAIQLYSAAIAIVAVYAVIDRRIADFNNLWHRHKFLALVVLSVMGFQLVAHFSVIHRAINGENQIIALVSQIKKIDSLLGEKKHLREISLSLGAKLLVIPLLGSFAKLFVDFVTNGIEFGNPCIHLTGLVQGCEVILFSCFLLAASDRLEALAGAVDSTQKTRNDSDKVSLAITLNIIREVVIYSRGVNVLFRNQVLGYIVATFCRVLYYEQFCIFRYKMEGAWSGLLMPVSVIGKLMAELVVLCSAAERLVRSGELLRAALQRRASNADTREEARGARSLLLLLKAAAPTELSLHGLVELRLRSLPAFCGVFVSCAVVIVQLNQ